MIIFEDVRIRKFSKKTSIKMILIVEYGRSWILSIMYLKYNVSSYDVFKKFKEKYYKKEIKL